MFFKRFHERIDAISRRLDKLETGQSARRGPVDRHGGLFDINKLHDRANRTANENEIRALCRHAYLGDASLCRILGRYKMFTHNHDIGLSSHLVLDGFWEFWLTEAIARVVKPGMKVVDAGANLGYYTLLMADIVGPTGFVHSFEPNEHVSTLLQRSVDINGFHDRVHVHKVALADFEGEATFEVPDGEPSKGRLQAADHASETAPKIAVSRLDMIGKIGDIDFMKIDIEGAEERMWWGMRDLLGRDRAMSIVLEFNTQRYRSGDAFLVEMERAGFDLNIVDPSLGICKTSRVDILGRPSNEDHLLFLERRR